MSRIERRVRDLINPYSTALASWWCQSARYWRLPRTITGNETAARPGLRRLGPIGRNGHKEGQGVAIAASRLPGTASEGAPDRHRCHH
jgi:hypothetical protein